MKTPTSEFQSFIKTFEKGNLDRAKSLLEQHPELIKHEGYQAHSLLRQCIEENEGHCHKKSHLQIANLLIPKSIQSFRKSILNDQVEEVEAFLNDDPSLAHAEFTAGRGIAQGLHHFKSLEVGKLLLDAEADLEALTTLNETPLILQRRFGTVAGMRFLLEKGANPNHGSKGFMPSDTLAERIELLLEFGWDINRGEMLHDANHGHGTRVQLWLKYGANPNAKNHEGQTALHLFAQKGKGKDAIEALISAGADRKALDHHGRTPLDLAQSAKFKPAKAFLAILG